MVAQQRLGKNPESFGQHGDPTNVLHRETVQAMDREGKIVRNLVDPPLKDTVAVADAGFVVARFWANNPGYWLLHCHMGWHEHLGLGAVIKVIEIICI